MFCFFSPLSSNWRATRWRWQRVNRDGPHGCVVSPNSPGAGTKRALTLQHEVCVDAKKISQLKKKKHTKKHPMWNIKATESAPYSLNLRQLRRFRLWYCLGCSSSPVLAVPGLWAVVVSVVLAVAEGGVGPLPGVGSGGGALPLGLGAVALFVVVPPVRAAAVSAALVLVGVVPQPLQVCQHKDQIFQFVLSGDQKNLYN